MVVVIKQCLLQQTELNSYKLAMLIPGLDSLKSITKDLKLINQAPLFIQEAHGP